MLLFPLSCISIICSRFLLLFLPEGLIYFLVTTIAFQCISHSRFAVTRLYHVVLIHGVQKKWTHKRYVCPPRFLTEHHRGGRGRVFFFVLTIHCTAFSYCDFSLLLPSSPIPSVWQRLKAMVIVWRLSGNIIRTVLYIANVIPLQWAQFTRTVHTAQLGLEFVFLCFLGCMIYLYVGVCFVLPWSVESFSIHVLALA